MYKEIIISRTQYWSIVDGIHIHAREVLRHGPKYCNPLDAIAVFKRLKSDAFREVLGECLPSDREEIHQSTNIVVREKSSEILAGTQFVGISVVGPNAVIGPTSVMFGPTILGERCYLGPFTEVRRSLLGNDLMLSHSSYLGHSIVGPRANIGAYFVTSVRNLKNEKVYIKTDKGMEDIDENLFGAILGSDCQFGVRVTVYPGRRVGDGNTILPETTIERNIQ